MYMEFPRNSIKIKLEPLRRIAQAMEEGRAMSSPEIGFFFNNWNPINSLAISEDMYKVRDNFELWACPSQLYKAVNGKYDKETDVTTSYIGYVSLLTLDQERIFRGKLRNDRIAPYAGPYLIFKNKNELVKFKLQM